jgi:hypothetical protein
MIRVYTTFLMLFLLLAAVSLVVGVIAKATGLFYVYGLSPISYLRFTSVCLLFAIALGVGAIALKLRE